MSVPSLTRFKVCTKCSCLKPAEGSYFNRAPKGRYGFDAWCKVCRTSYRRENKQRIRERGRKYRALNREARNQYSRQYYAANKEVWREQGKRRYEANREAISKQIEEWRKANPEKWRAIQRASCRRRRARLNGSGWERYTEADLNHLWHEQDGCCAYCRVVLFGVWEVEHMVPLSRGGADRLSNICLACPPCNRRKSNRTAEEFKEELRRDAQDH